MFILQKCKEKFNVGNAKFIIKLREKYNLVGETTAKKKEEDNFVTLITQASR